VPPIGGKRCLTVLFRMLRPLVLGAIALLAACAQTPDVKVDAKAQAKPVEEQEVREPEPEPKPEPKPRRRPTAQEQGEAQKLAMRAVEPLNAGDEATARRDLERALSLDPENKLASSLMRQITEDPATLFGSQHFMHRVERDESLSMIAGRFLGDIYLFYGLARYNDIRVPRQVHVGQTIKVPGKPLARATPDPGPRPGAKPPPPSKKGEARPPPPPPPEPARPEPPVAVSPGQKAYERGLQLLRNGDQDRDGAYGAFVEAVRLDPQHREARAQAEKTRQDLIQQHTRIATTALRRDQDPKTAIRHWDRVLQLDPNNASAKAQREQAVLLFDKIKTYSGQK
jgi:tetratricopeptide (TPR) repeat protein